MAGKEAEKAEKKVDPERKARWDAFLAKAEKENPLFAEQEKNGEFKTIPDSFE